MQVGGRDIVDFAGAVDGASRDQDVLDLRAVGAGVHSQRASDRAGYAGKELEATHFRRERAQRDVDVERAGACIERVFVLSDDAGETSA